MPGDLEEMKDNNSYILNATSAMQPVIAISISAVSVGTRADAENSLLPSRFSVGVRRSFQIAVLPTAELITRDLLTSLFQLTTLFARVKDGRNRR